MKEKKRVLGKRHVDQDMMLMDSPARVNLRLNAGSDKKSRGSEAHGQETPRKDGDAEPVEEAASRQGAAGQLTGAEESTFQEP
jgi:hypothetical protein